ncbi:DUF4157 domain-containing protein [Aquimarina sp. RZ0]|uniref:eCIS core domain-containing protein n=1 Tax=Aquimarina sp. RZ0 TaxID=2607730 RepID=UPI0011F212CD|nr:DUF4157 domain-containing protein [Aquimarina sp. RZ0]KAA1245218.1 DUF4157 domain-containing protein [Aquimarina sp. RZ0]
MKTQTENTQESQNSIAPRVTSEPSDGGTAQLKDNRTSSLDQRKLRSGIDGSNNGKNPIQQKTSPERSRRNNTGLPDTLKSGIENLSGYSMDDVKVHYNSSKPVQLQALAYAQGTDIHIAPGQEKHLSHEAWHVVQQKQGRVKPTRQLKSKVSINDDAGLEREADVMGAKAINMKTLQLKESLSDKPENYTNKKIKRKSSSEVQQLKTNKELVLETVHDTELLENELDNSHSDYGLTKEEQLKIREYYYGNIKAKGKIITIHDLFNRIRSIRTRNETIDKVIESLSEAANNVVPHGRYTRFYRSDNRPPKTINKDKGFFARFPRSLRYCKELAFKINQMGDNDFDSFCRGWVGSTQNEKEDQIPMRSFAYSGGHKGKYEYGVELTLHETNRILHDAHEIENSVILGVKVAPDEVAFITGIPKSFISIYKKGGANESWETMPS